MASLRTERYAIALAVVAGIALRVWTASTSLGHLDGDEAIVGLMARHIADGEITAFYWGQAYGGPLEAILAAPLIALFGASTWALRAVPLTLHVVAVLLCWRILLRIRPQVAVLGAALFWIWPGYFVWWSLKGRAFYGAALVVTLAGLLLGLRIVERWQLRDVALFGAVAGVGWWLTPQTVFVLLPLTLWVIASSRRRWRELFGLAAVAVVAFCAGAAPWLFHNLRTGWSSLEVPPMPHNSTYLSRLFNFFNEALPAALGFRLDATVEWIGGPIGFIGYLGLLLWLVYVATSKTHLALATIAGTYPLLYALSPFSQGEARYLSLLAPILVMLVMTGLASWRWRVALVPIALVLSTATLLVMTIREMPLPTAPDVRVPLDLQQVAIELESMNVRAVYADYWVAYPIVFFSDERVLATPFRGVMRYEPYREAVDRAPGSAFLVPSDSQTVDIVRSGYARLGAGYEEVDLGSVRLFRSDAEITEEMLPELDAPELDPAER